MDVRVVKKYLKPDSTWSAWKINNHTQFIQDMVPELALREEVHEDIIKEFEIIKYLLIYSYYKYQFFDVALNKAVQIMEMAFKIRYKEMVGKEWPKNKNLETLIKELDALSLFESHITHISRMRSLRNDLLHPDRHSFAGSVYSGHISSVAQIINELYDDVALRQKRKALVNDLQNFITINLSDEIEIVQNNKRRNIHKLQILLIDNKNGDLIYYIVVVPAFSLDQYRESVSTSKLVPQVLLLELTNILFDNGVIVGYDMNSKTETVIKKIEDADEIVKYKEWKTEQESLNKIHRIDHSWSFNVGTAYFYLMERLLLK
jgi:hypothetical protein